MTYLIRACHLERVDELGRHRRQRILRPGEEPVASGTVDETRELLCPARKDAAHGAEAQYDVEAVTDAADEEFIQILIRVHHTCIVCTGGVG